MQEARQTAMGIFRRKIPHHHVPIHPDNVTSKDWIIVLEACTIVDPSPVKLRIARTMQERNIVKKRSMFGATKHYLVVEDYDPRIHSLYFCPQLYKHDDDGKLVPLEGEEIGRLIASALESGIKDRRPWYEPEEQLPNEPVITTPMETKFDTVVVEMPKARAAAG
jgi:hypothetical protein